MPHPSHKLKAYTADYKKPLVFCSECGKEEDEAEINWPCNKTFYIKKVDIIITPAYRKFVSGLPD